VKYLLMLIVATLIYSISGCATTGTTAYNQYPDNSELQRRDTEIRTQQLRKSSSQPVYIPPAPVYVPSYH
jgi:hypothetical protein